MAVDIVPVVQQRGGERVVVVEQPDGSHWYQPMQQHEAAEREDHCTEWEPEYRRHPYRVIQGSYYHRQHHQDRRRLYIRRPRCNELVHGRNRMRARAWNQVSIIFPHIYNNKINIF